MSELREQLRLAIPLALGQVGMQFLSVVDTAMLGHHSDVALAGSGIANGLLWAFTVLGLGVVLGLDSLIPQAVGSGEHRRARTLFVHGLRTAVYVGIPVTAAAALAPAFTMLMGVEAAAQAEVTRYVLGRLPAIIPFLLYSAARSFLQSYSITRPLMITVVVANVLNFAANSLLIFGDASLTAVGLPAMGVPALGGLGAAISTSVVTVSSMVIMLGYARSLYRKQQPDERTPAVPADAPNAADAASDAASGSQQPERSPSRVIFRLGWPVSMQLFAEVGLFGLVGTLAGRLGTVPAAAHQLTLIVVSTAFHLVLGVSAATSVRVGLAVGQGDHRAARRAGLTGMVLGVSLLGVVALAYLLAPHFLARLMSDDPDVIAMAIPLFHIAAVFQIGDALQVIGGGALRGAGDTRSPMWAHLFGNYVIGLTLGIASAFYWQQGAAGLWWGLAAGLSCAGVLVAWRFMALTRAPIARAGS